MSERKKKEEDYFIIEKNKDNIIHVASSMIVKEAMAY